MTPQAIAAVLARAVAGRPVNGEADGLPEHLRPAVERIGSFPPAERLDLLRTVVAAAPGGAEILGALDALGPEERAEPSPRPPCKVRCAASIPPLPIEWLWPGRVPLGMLTLFAGDPKLGKSYATLAMAAAISRGAPLPGETAPSVDPGSVVLLNAEDDASRTIVPRLKAAGAALDRIHLLEAVYLADGSEALPSLKTDIDRIGETVERLGDCRLCVIDPVSAYLGSTDDHRNSELRGLLSPLKATAERLGVAVVLVTHLNKGTSTNGQHRVAGSIAYTAAVRANFLFVRDRDDETGHRVLFLDNGGNLAPQAPTLAYRIEDRGDGPRVEWEDEPVPVTASEALARERDQRDPEGRKDIEEAKDWLREALADGPVPAKDIERAGREAGFSPSTLKRAKGGIGAKTDRDGFGRGSVCYWTLESRTPDGAHRDQPDAIETIESRPVEAEPYGLYGDRVIPMERGR